MALLAGWRLDVLLGHGTLRVVAEARQAARRQLSTSPLPLNREIDGRRKHHGIPAAVTRLSKNFVPTSKADVISQEQQQIESLALLVRGGYIRQSSSGHFTLLPNGLRMIKKLERIIDEEMEAIGASRIEMPTMLSASLWRKSGRMDTMGSELFKVKDRKGSEYLLAPTAEEEVTKLVGDEVHSWRQLPVRVYQITTKHRDEPRPRSGLLRTRSFLMKDLYTFDASVEEAQEAYRDVTKAYVRIMNRLFGTQGRDWKSAVADSGAMGGLQSHEYQVPDALGEDVLVSCDTCGYTANSELAASLPRSQGAPAIATDVHVSLYGPADLAEQGYTMTALVTSHFRAINLVKSAKAIAGPVNMPTNVQLYPQENGTHWDWKDRPEGPMVRFDKLRVVLDHECRGLELEEISEAILDAIEAYGGPPGSPSRQSQGRQEGAPTLHDYFGAQYASSDAPIECEFADVRSVEDGDTCAACNEGKLRSEKTIEVGHTFLLGTRYSKALGYSVQGRDASSLPRPLQMGCYGIGLTRILGVLAQSASRRFAALAVQTAEAGEEERAKKALLARKGFAWDALVAPFQVLVLPLDASSTLQAEAASRIIEGLLRLSRTHNQISAGQIQSILSSVFEYGPLQPSDIALDDRSQLSVGARLSEADLVGYPVVILLGKHFEATGQVEVRHRTRTSFATTHIPLAELVQ